MLRKLIVLIFMSILIKPSHSSELNEFQHSSAGFAVAYPEYWVSSIDPDSEIAKNYRAPDYLPKKEGEFALIWESGEPVNENIGSMSIGIERNSTDSPQQLIEAIVKHLLRANNHFPGMVQISSELQQYEKGIHYQKVLFSSAETVVVSFRSNCFLIILQIMLPPESDALLQSILNSVQYAS